MGSTELKDRLREAREAKGLRPAELAKLATLPPRDGKADRHVGASHIAQIERGEKENITTEIAAALARELDVTLDWLLLGKEPMRPEGPS